VCLFTTDHLSGPLSPDLKGRHRPLSRPHHVSPTLPPHCLGGVCADRDYATPPPPRDKRRMDLPATDGQNGLPRCFRAAYDAVLHRDAAAPSRGVDHLRVEQLGQGQPTRLEPRALVLAPWRRHPVPVMRHEGRQVGGVASTPTEWHPARRHPLRALVQHGLGHGQRALPPCTLSSNVLSGSYRRSIVMQRSMQQILAEST
jgi:hypothetical protein